MAAEGDYLATHCGIGTEHEQQARESEPLDGFRWCGRGLVRFRAGHGGPPLDQSATAQGERVTVHTSTTYSGSRAGSATGDGRWSRPTRRRARRVQQFSVNEELLAVGVDGPDAELLAGCRGRRQPVPVRPSPMVRRRRGARGRTPASAWRRVRGGIWPSRVLVSTPNWVKNAGMGRNHDPNPDASVRGHMRHWCGTASL